MDRIFLVVLDFNEFDRFSRTLRRNNKCCTPASLTYEIFLNMQFWIVINRRGHLTTAEQKYYNLIIACPF